MKKYKNLLIILGIIFVLLALANLGRLTNKAAEPEMILFFGDTCPHCENVEAFINENNIKDKISFQELEVYRNQENAALLRKKAIHCDLDISNGIGVPFFFDGENCLVGGEAIIEFLKEIK